MNINYPVDLSVKDLLHNSKALQPLAEEFKILLTEVAQLDVTTYSESDVRAEIIDPIVRALGYKKQTSFSTEREKHLKILDADLFVDYSMIVLEENFWVIEAKKVKRKRERFTPSEVKQALLYAVHPEINAGLLVLCDGRILHVFDREADLSKPVLEIEIKHILRDFDKLRTLLSPWQAWFFQKRRVLRMLDKVFDREINMARLHEFQSIVTARLEGKRALVFDNERAATKSLDQNGHINHLRGLSAADLIDVHFFTTHSAAAHEAMSETLLAHSQRSTFPVLYLIFPDEPREANDNYWGCALHFLLKLEEKVDKVNWLPSFLSEPGSAETPTSNAAKRLIGMCLSGFQSNPDRQVMNLYAAAARRIVKQMLVMIPDLSALAEQRHALLRHHLDELSIAQFMSSPASHMVRLLDQFELMSSARFASSQKDSERGTFNLAKAQQALRSSWAMECSMLGDGTQYREARKARTVEEIGSTEAMSVVYDQLGHLTLCMLNRFPKWKAYALSEHKADVERIARFGSWAAKEWLGLSIDARLPRPTPEEFAKRFFLGEIEIFRALSIGYGYQVG